MFGGLGILEGSLHNWTCIPLSIRLHDGLQNASEWKGASISYVSQMVEDGYQDPGGFPASVGHILPHRACPEKLGCLNRSGTVRIEIITKTKRTGTSFENQAPASQEEGVHLKEWYKLFILKYYTTGNKKVNLIISFY